jgi:hypothetical protein
VFNYVISRRRHEADGETTLIPLLIRAALRYSKEHLEKWELKHRINP